jgi:hypothetical protein
MKKCIIALTIIALSHAFAHNHDEKKPGHDVEHNHVSEKANHEHDENHHKPHDHKAHHPDHKDDSKKNKKK